MSTGNDAQDLDVISDMAIDVLESAGYETVTSNEETETSNETGGFMEWFFSLFG